MLKSTISTKSIVKCSQDYGFIKRYNVKKQKNAKIPMSFVELWYCNVKKEFTQKRYGFISDPYENTSKEEAYEIFKLRKKLKLLQLNDENIWKRELERDEIVTPKLLKLIYYTICNFLDVIYKNKPIDRFWFLETVARMPYFSYVAVLHLYETLGWWDLGGDLKKQHYNEEINETYHLRIMESLGGDERWWNRFLARHGAIAYYVILLVLFMVSPRIAYLSSELLEMHAVDTYVEFCESNEELLKQLPVTNEAVMYCNYAQNMYDVFKKIGNDEYEHAKSMMLNKQMYKSLK
jgi:ubiquinol oxidase